MPWRITRARSRPPVLSSNACASPPRPMRRLTSSPDIATGNDCRSSAAPGREALAAASDHVVGQRFEGVTVGRGRKRLQLGTGLVPKGLRIVVRLVDAVGVSHDANDLGVIRILQGR